jgi:eight-cysteine-cluster-containing protein
MPSHAFILVITIYYNMKPQIPLLMISIAALVLVSGCISADPATFAKLNPMVQEFMNEHPNAEIRVTHYTEEEAQAILGTIEEECQKDGITAKEYYRISIEDAETDLKVTAWIDWENQVIECAVKTGGLPGPDDDECKPVYKVRCYEGHAYWYDSCGNRGVKKEACGNGCDAGRCIGHDVCKNEGGYCSYVGLVEEAVVSGEIAEVIASTKTTDTLTGLITGAPYLEPVTTASTDVQPVNIDAEERCERYYTCPNGRQFQYCELIKEELPITCEESNVEGAGKVCTSGGVEVACVCKTEPELLCATEDTVCRPGYQKSRLWCPDSGVCCMPRQTDCEPEAESRCYGGHEYWYDSCGNKVMKREYCQWGCIEGQCKPAPPVDEGCFETDGGYDIYEHGVVEAGTQRYEDHCNEDGTLTEKFCTETDAIKWNTTACPTGYTCREAACVKVEFCGSSTEGVCTTDSDCVEDGCSGSICRSINDDPVTTTCEFLDCFDNEQYDLNCGCVEGECIWHEGEVGGCTDSDEGKNYYVKGTTTKGDDVVTDACTNTTEAGSNIETLKEYFCVEESNIEHALYACPNGCSDGACVEIATPVCTADSDCGSNTTVLYCHDDMNSSFVYQNVIIPTCVNPGQSDSYCSDDYTSVLLENCTAGCQEGSCV